MFEQMLCGRRPPVLILVTLVCLFHQRTCMDLPQEVFRAEDHGTWIPTRSTIPVDTRVHSTFTPIAPGTAQYDAAKQALVQKIQISASRFERAKKASSRGEHDLVGELLTANVQEWEYVDGYLEAITNGGPETSGIVLQGQPEVQQYADALENLARFKLSQNNFQEAEPLIRDTCTLLERGYGIDHQLTSSCYATRASVLLRLGKQDDLNDMVQSTQTKLNEHAEAQTVTQMQSQVLNWIDTLPKLDTLAQQFMKTNDDVEQKKLLKKAKREARKIAHDEPDRSVAAHEYVKIMEKMVKAQRIDFIKVGKGESRSGSSSKSSNSKSSRNSKSSSRSKNSRSSRSSGSSRGLVEGNEDEDVHVVHESLVDERKDAYLKMQIERLERLVKSDGISEQKLREISTRLGVIRSFQREGGRDSGSSTSNGNTNGGVGKNSNKSSSGGALSALMGALSAFMWSSTGVSLMLTSVFVGLYGWKHILDERAKVEARRLLKEQSLRKIKQRKRREHHSSGSRSTSVSTDSTQNEDILNKINSDQNDGISPKSAKSTTSSSKEVGSQSNSRSNSVSSSSSNIGNHSNKRAMSEEEIAEKNRKRLERQQRRERSRQLEAERRLRLSTADKEKRERQARELAAATREQTKLMEEIARAEAEEIASREERLRELAARAEEDQRQRAQQQALLQQQKELKAAEAENKEGSTSSPSKNKKSVAMNSSNNHKMAQNNRKGNMIYNSHGGHGNNHGRSIALPPTQRVGPIHSHLMHLRHHPQHHIYLAQQKLLQQQKLNGGLSQSMNSKQYTSNRQQQSSGSGSGSGGGRINITRNKQAIMRGDHQSRPPWNNSGGGGGGSAGNNYSVSNDNTTAPVVQSDLRVTAEMYSPPNDLRDMVTVSIQLIADTRSMPLRPGQGLYIASSLHGAWNPSDAVMLSVEPLEKGEGVVPTHYVWRYVLTVPKFLGSFEYKYIVRSIEYDPNSSNPHKSLCNWESGAKRVVDLKSVKEDILLKNDQSVHFPSPGIVAAPVAPPIMPNVNGVLPSVGVVGDLSGIGDLGSVGSVVRNTDHGDSNNNNGGSGVLQHNVNNMSMSEFNVSMDFLEGDDDLPPPMTTNQPPSPVGLSFLRPASSPHDTSNGSPSHLTWGADTDIAIPAVIQPVTTEQEDPDLQQKLLESAAEQLLG
jgi:hypothetical protein